VLAVAIIILSLRQSAKRKVEMERFAASHGWRFLGRDASQLLLILDQVDPSENWTPDNIVLVGGRWKSIYLFSYSAGPKGDQTDEYGFACLAEHAGWRNEEPVSIFRRVPVVEKLLSDRVELGGPDFRREFTVQCRRPDVATTVVDNEVQSILLEHALGPQWYLEVRIVGGRILVTTSHAQKLEEWDYLITMTKRLRAALE